MTHYVLSSAAEVDLTEIMEFIAEDSPRAALSILGEIRSALRRLAELPDIGHRRAGLPDDVRLWPVRSYLIAYRPSSDPILILRVMSGFRDVERLLD